LPYTNFKSEDSGFYLTLFGEADSCFFFIFVYYLLYMARDISGLIRELLLKHDCVIVPGFGAFIGNYFPARTDRKEGLFEPPSRKITFNRHLTGNDGLLIGHVSAVHGVGYAAAREIVSEWSEDLKRKILADKPVMIDMLGTFTLNYERAIVFEPDLSVNYLLSAYGLSAYYRQPVSGFDIRKKALQRRSEPVVNQPSMRSLLARAAVIGPILIALALVPFNDKIFKSNIEESNLNPLAKAELEFNREQIDAGRDSSTIIYPIPGSVDSESVALPETMETEAPATSQVQAVKTAPVSKTPEVKPSATSQNPAVQPAATSQAPVRRAPAVVVEEYRYLVIIGSFKGEENALTMVEKLRRQGFDPEVAGGPDGYLRVSAQAFPTLDEAKVVLERMRKEYTGAWVYKSR
jgi:cell division septation protein DedD/nucleoid DNA-binding protein